VDIPDSVVTAEIAVGSGPSSVAIAGTLALVANQDSDTLSLIDLNTMQVTTIAVGRGPRGVATDPNTNKVYVTNQDDGTISVIDLTNLQAAPGTITLPPNSRPGAIQLVAALGFAVVTMESASSSAQALIVTLSSGSAGPVLVNPARNGGAGQIAVYANTVYFADQSGGTVSVSPMGNNGSFTTSTVKVDIGARALAVDATDKLLLVANEGSGTVVMIDMTTNQIVNRINAVRSEHETDGQDHNNHNDRLAAQNAPAITSISQNVASRPSTFTLTINGTNLQGADDVFFVDPSTLPGKSGSHSHGDSGEPGHGPFGARDTNITATNIQVNGAGTQLTATITISKKASAGQRVVRVEALNGDTSFVASSVNLFQVN
jgi:YVTN family beta-propeller protein